MRWGIVDVHSWLEKLPDGALTFWEAFDRVEPIGDEWEQTAMIMEKLLVKLYAQAKMDPPSWQDLMPPRYKRVRKPTAITKQQSAASFDALLKITKLDKVANG